AAGRLLCQLRLFSARCAADAGRRGGHGRPDHRHELRHRGADGRAAADLRAGVLSRAGHPGPADAADPGVLHGHAGQYHHRPDPVRPAAEPHHGALHGLSRRPFRAVPGMSDDRPEQSEKTEDPSQKRLEDAHKKGDVAKSQEVTTWFMIFGSALIFAFVAPITGSSILETLTQYLARADLYEAGGPGFNQFVFGATTSLLGALLIPMILLALCGVAGNMVQHRMVFTAETIKPKLSKISPLAGFKRLFSSEALVNFGKGLFKLVVFTAIMVMVVWPDRDRLSTIMTADPIAILALFQEVGIKIFIATLIAITVVALLDYLYVRHKWWQR